MGAGSSDTTLNGLDGVLPGFQGDIFVTPGAGELKSKLKLVKKCSRLDH